METKEGAQEQCPEKQQGVREKSILFLWVGFHWRFILPHYLGPQIGTTTYDEV